jgi:hypothetical protein
MADEVHLSLAQLAAMNTDDVQTLTSRAAPAGVFRVKCEFKGGKESEPTEDGRAPLIRFNYAYEVLMAKPTSKDVTPESCIGRKYNESYTLWPSDLVGMIGLLKGRHQKVGLPNSGIMGGMEGAEPGWMDSADEAEFDIQIRTGLKDGEVRNYWDWLKPDPKRWAAEEAANAEGAEAAESEVVAG